MEKQLKPPTWDEGAINAFLKRPSVESAAIDLPRSGGKLLFFTHDLSVIQEVGNNIDGILSWLGAPAGFITLLFWRDDPRRLDADEWPSKTTVNGGWTIPGSNTIIVYRQEEYDRVVIHEAIHALRWDWEMPSTPLPCWELGPNSRLAPHLFEAWTELYAEWLWCGWHRKSWAAQRAHMDVQAIQILARASTADWKENTNVFAYYVLKAALAPHIAFLWTFRNGATPAERMHVLCGLATPRLAELRRAAVSIKPAPISLRMTHA